AAPRRDKTGDAALLQHPTERAIPGQAVNADAVPPADQGAPHKRQMALRSPDAEVANNVQDFRHFGRFRGSAGHTSLYWIRHA
nr:hypothetical protein [Afipia sp.]